jgi:Histidine kinase-, DNA gyrase B-, and HSP90-like ATPase
MTAIATAQLPLIRVDRTLNSLRSSGYSLEAAVGEPIDNSLEANARNVRIYLLEGTREIGTKRKTERLKVVDQIAFADDGDGMPEDILARCLILGESSRYGSRSGMGRFGVGATLGAISQARRIEVYSRTKSSEPYMYTFVDLDEIAEGRQEFMPEPQPKGIPSEFGSLLSPKSAGTLVIWSKCDKLAETSETSKKTLKAKDIRTVESVRTDLVKYVARTYRYYINSGRNIEVNGIKVAPHDPLYMADSRFPEDPKATLEYEEVLEWPTPSNPETKAEIRVRMTLLPEAWRPVKGSGRETTFNRERRVIENEPLSIVRAKREIFWDIIPRFYPDGVREIARWIGVEISFDPVLDEAFQVRNVKRGVEPVDELRHALRKMIQPNMMTLVKRVRTVWTANDNAQKTVKGVHSAAEDIAADAEQTSVKSRAGRDTPSDERDKRLEQVAEQAVKALPPGEDESAPDPQAIATVQERVKKLPFSIVDDQWPGNEFFATEHLGSKTVVTYNNKHPFFSKVYSKILAAAGLHSDEEGGESLDPKSISEAARIVQIGVDLLIVAYAKAEAMDDDENTRPLYDTLRTQWGLFLSQMVQKLPDVDL